MRLPDWDYSSAAAYFITICTKGKQSFFGRIDENVMAHSDLGSFAHRKWEEIPGHFPHVELDEFMIMPNHLHGILHFHADTAAPNDAVAPFRDSVAPCNDIVAAFHETPLREEDGSFSRRMSAISAKSGSLSVVIRLYKGSVTRWARKNGHQQFSWQSRFHDHIIRNQHGLDHIRRYIHQNPTRWTLDPYHT